MVVIGLIGAICTVIPAAIATDDENVTICPTPLPEPVVTPTPLPEPVVTPTVASYPVSTAVTVETPPPTDAFYRGKSITVTGGTIYPISTPLPEPVVTPTAVPNLPKFRVDPTITLRPVNDVINKSQNGIVELYMNNPSLNDVALNADVQIIAPSGISVSGDGFGYGGAAGTVAGKFTLPPGTVRTIHININGERTGTFTLHFTGLYWAGDNKDAYQQVSLTHRLVISDSDTHITPTPDIQLTPISMPTSPSSNTDDDMLPDSIPTIYVAAMFGVLIVVLLTALISRR